MRIGIDIGGTSCKLGLVVDGSVIARARIPTKGHRNEHAFADALARATEELLAGREASSLGIGAPNGDQRTGNIDRAPNLPWNTAVPLRSMMHERLHLPCLLGNDANAAALGEWRYGAGRGIDDLLVVTLGTGLGSGFIVDGKPLLGPRGNAGELGHTLVADRGRSCSCGRNGCLEAYVSIRGMRQTYEGSSGDISLLDEEGVLPITKAALNGDPAALLTYQTTARWLSMGLANASAITGPARIVITGGIARSGQLLMAPLRDRFERDLLYIHEGAIELVLGELPEDDAGILGAAALGELA